MNRIKRLLPEPVRAMLLVGIEVATVVIIAMLCWR